MFFLLTLTSVTFFCQAEWNSYELRGLYSNNKTRAAAARLKGNEPRKCVGNGEKHEKERGRDALKNLHLFSSSAPFNERLMGIYIY